MKKVITGFNDSAVSDVPHMKNWLEKSGYQNDKFPLEVRVIENDLDDDGVPLIFIDGQRRDDAVSQYWFIFEEDDEN